MSFSSLYGPTNEAESHAILDAAVVTDVSHIDTSNVYGMGRSESIIRTYVNTSPSGRDHFTIATKASIKRNSNGAGKIFYNPAEHLQTELEASLNRLGIEPMDLFYVNHRDPDIPTETWLV